MRTTGCSIHDPELVLVVDHLNAHSERRAASQSREGINRGNQFFEKWKHVLMLPGVAACAILEPERTEAVFEVRAVRTELTGFIPQH